MKILILGDTHIWNHSQLGGPMEGGLNRRCRGLIRDISDTVQGAITEYGIEAVVQLGDFFDKSNPPPAVMLAAMELLRRFDVQWHILAGNHDIRAFGVPSAIAPLRHLPNVKVYEEPALVELGGTPWAMVPFTARTADESVKKALELLSPAVDETRFACLHYGAVREYSSNRPDVTPLRDYFWAGHTLDRYPTNWFFGHEHGSRAVANTSEHTKARSLGSFCQHNFGDPNITYIGAIVDTNLLDGVKVVELMGPRFVDLREVDFTLLGMHRNASAVYAIFSPEDASLAERLREVGLITDFRIAPIQREESGDGFAAEPAPLTSSEPVDIDQCVLEELQTKRSDEELLKAWEYYEQLKQRI